MTRLGMVGHVMKKDLREHWPVFLLYVAIVIIATLHAVAIGPFAASPLGVSASLVVLVGVLLAAMAVQGDSPTRTDAYWGSHPFAPSAMVIAKVGLALLLLAIALPGQVIAVRSFGLAAADALQPVAESALLYAAWLAAAMCIAALVRDIRSAALVVVAIAVGYPLLSAVAGIEALPFAMGQSARLVAVALELLVLGWVYRTRDARVRTRLVGFALAMSAVVAIDPARAFADPVALPTAVDRPAFALQPDDPATPVEPSRMDVVLLVPRHPRDLRFTLHQATITVRLRDGGRLRLPAQNQAIDLVYGGTAVLPRRLGAGEEDASSTWLSRNTVTADLAPGQRRTIDEHGVAGIELDGRIIVTQARAAGTMPLVAGARLVVPAQRISIAAVSSDPAATIVELRTSHLGEETPSADRPGQLWSSATTFALISSHGQKVRSLSLASARGTLDGLVLPGVRLETGVSQFGWHAPPSPAVPRQQPDSATMSRQALAASRAARSVPATAWSGPARLLVISHIPIGGYPLHLEMPPRP